MSWESLWVEVSEDMSLPKSSSCLWHRQMSPDLIIHWVMGWGRPWTLCAGSGLAKSLDHSLFINSLMVETCASLNGGFNVEIGGIIYVHDL